MKKIVLVTSLYRLRKCHACSGRYDYLVSKLGPEWGDKDDINLLDILKHNGVADCLWALCATVKHPLPIFEKKHLGDDRPRKAIDAARKFVNGEITSREWAAARAATWAAARAAARAATGAAARAAARAAASGNHTEVFGEDSMTARDLLLSAFVVIVLIAALTGWLS